MKPGDIVTFAEPHAQRREVEYGPGPYLLLKEAGPDNYWILARLNDGLVLDRVWFHKKVLQTCTFLNAAKDAIDETQV